MAEKNEQPSKHAAREKVSVRRTHPRGRGSRTQNRRVRQELPPDRGFSNGDGRIDEVVSPTEAGFRVLADDDERCIITPHDLCWDGGELPEGCVATLEEAQAAFAKAETEQEATYVARKLRLKDIVFQDSTGKHSRYGVRSMGPGKGFGILDKLQNRFLNLAAGSTRRLDCYLALQNHDEDITL